MSGWIRPRDLAQRGILGMNRRNVGYIGQYNARERYPLVDDKLKTKLIAQKAGVQVPELLHVVRAQHEIESVNELLDPMSEFVIKPAQGSGGKGILVIVARSGASYVKSSGDEIDLQSIKRHLSNVISGLHSLGGRTDVAILESLIRISPLFDRISHEGVPDIRLIVFRGYPVMGMLRLATRESDGKANLHQGAVGVGLDIGTGRSVSAVQNNQPVHAHPDTGANLTHVEVPDWRELLLLASRCFEVTQLGYLGCDIVIDQDRGPMLLELNARPGLSIQIANRIGLLPRLRHIEALESIAPDPAARVDYAMDKFTGGNL